MILAECNKINLVRMPGHKGIDSNGNADQRAPYTHLQNLKPPVASLGELSGTGLLGNTKRTGDPLPDKKKVRRAF